jgi:hypothetical protein
MGETLRLLDRILASTPGFHKSETEVRDWDPAESLLSAESVRHLRTDHLTCYGITPELAHYLLSHIRAGMSTLETGAGTSTLVFAIGGANHVAVTPDADEAAAIRAYADALGIDLSRVAFALEPSDRYLPKATLSALDIVLLDGKHAFPWPIIDWFYTAEMVQEGGLLILDDLELRSVGVLVEFLKEDSHWALEGHPGGRTAVFRKLSSHVHDVAWHMQRWTINQRADSDPVLRYARGISSALRRTLRSYLRS